MMKVERVRTRFLLTYLCLAALMMLLLASCSSKPKMIGSAPFRWIAIDTGSESVGVLEHAAIMVDAKVGGKDVWMQLDTGAKNIVLSPTYLDSVGVQYERDKNSRIESGSQQGGYIGAVNSVSIAGITLNKPQVILWEESANAPSIALARQPEDPKPYVGTLGVGAFGKCVLALNFTDEILEVYDRMPDGGQEVAIRFPASGGAIGGRPTMTLRMGDTAFLAMYDTGSSALELLLRPAEFLKMTGLLSLDDAPLQFLTKSWDNQIAVYGVPYEKAIEVGGQRLVPGRIWASPLMDDFYESCDCEVLIGNDLFIGRTVYLDFAERRFAIAGGE